MLADEYAQWLKRSNLAPISAPESAARGPYCKAEQPKHVRAGDFETEYSLMIPERFYKEAIQSVQRGHQAAPYCPYSKTPARLMWRRVANWMLAHYVCPHCCPSPVGNWFTGE